MLYPSCFGISIGLILMNLAVALIRKKEELKKRCLYHLLFTSIFFVCYGLGSIIFTAYLFLVLLGGILELAVCAGTTQKIGFAFAVFISAMAIFAILFLPVYLGTLPLFLLVMLALLSSRKMKGQSKGRIALIFALAIVMPGFVAAQRIYQAGSSHVIAIFVIANLNDAAAYLTGKTLGKTKIPFLSGISPNKTAEGYLGGLGGTIGGVAFFSGGFSLFEGPLIEMAAFTLLCFLAINAGDLVFSAAKRRLEVKDFSSLLSYHGGLLDRMDSAIFAAPFYLAAMSLNLLNLFH